MPTVNTDNLVLLTGASGKVGLKIAKVFLDLGFGLIAHCNNNENFLQCYKDKAIIFKADLVKQLPEICELIDKYKEKICGLVNCAAVFNKGNLKNFDKLRETMQINAFAPTALISKYAEIVQKGNIINILDGNIYGYNENYQNYRISKLFLEEITKQSAMLLAPQIRVNALAFGMLEEEKTESNLRALQKEILKSKISDKEIAKSIEFLWTCENITGQTIFLDNGVHLL